MGVYEAEIASTALGQPTSALTRLRSRGRLLGRVALLGPAFVAAVAYVDPGNFAANVTAGARHGYLLVWVVVLADLMAMVVQYLSAKLGVATSRDLAELCRDRYPRPVTLGLWLQAELVAMATDLAEFIGAALGLHLLFGIALFPAGLITAMTAFGLLALQQQGYRQFELVIAGLLAVVFAGLSSLLWKAGVDPASAAQGLVPAFSGSESVVLAAGIIGATVMPHAIYLHSGLTKDRIRPANEAERRALVKVQRLDVVAALSGAGVINVVLLLAAAGLFHRRSDIVVDSIESVHASLGHIVGGGCALAFALALFASGIASSSVGTYAGQVVMQGFIHREIPIWIRRSVTALPALLVLALNLPTTTVLVCSQVALSFGIPFALIPLILLTRRRDVMGSHVNRLATTIVATMIAGLIVALNVYLLVATLT